MTNRKSGDGDLRLEILEKILHSACDHGIRQLSFTGGEPTVHPRFGEIIKMTYEAGYSFGFVSNGWNFNTIYEKVIPFREKLAGITFSLDGAREKTHDRLRGNGSFRKLMSAVSICVAKEIPFTFNSLITSNNREELGEIADLAGKLGSRGLRFGHLMPTPHMMEAGLELSAEEQKRVDTAVLNLDKKIHMPVIMAPGYYTKKLFPCAALKMQEINIDCRGQVSMCCHLSGYGNGERDGDVIADLNDVEFSDAHALFAQDNKKFCQAKRDYFSGDAIMDSDYFPCWFCLKYFRKLDWLKNYPESTWYEESGLII
jgi:MoaA/NifB/PqqE/SkfB family radical SAM enzyme